MFKTKQQINSLEQRIAEKINKVETKLNDMGEYMELVECETCGCLLDKKTAVKGKSTIEVEARNPRFRYYPPTSSTKEVIKEHYFCKVHGKKK